MTCNKNEQQQDAKIMLNYKPNGWRWLGRPLKRLFDENKTGHQGLTQNGWCWWWWKHSHSQATERLTNLCASGSLITYEVCIQQEMTLCLSPASQSNEFQLLSRSHNCSIHYLTYDTVYLETWPVSLQNIFTVGLGLMLGIKAIYCHSPLSTYIKVIYCRSPL